MTDSTEKPKKRSRKPFLALELDAFEDAAKAARKAGVHEDVILAGLPRVWLHCWRKKSDRVRPEDLDQFFTGADERLRRALASCGFIEIDGDPAGDRVKGAARLLAISASKAKGGHAAKGNLRRGSGEPAPGPAHAGGAPGIGPADARLLQPSAISQQPASPPNPPQNEGGQDQKPGAPRRRRDREPPPPPPKVLGWTTVTPQGEEWRRRLNGMLDRGAFYAVTHLEKLLPIGFKPTPGGITALVVRAPDPFFADWCSENYSELLSEACVIVEKPPTSPPELRVVGGAA